MTAKAKSERRYLTARQVKQRYDDITDMTLWRWLRDPELAFPQPEVIRRRRFWREDKLDAWDEQRAQGAA